uniref:Uncharacterized protein n=1 Tax=Timema genevievae TaxID=629358 RepID=A0A7R9K3Z7_TIMGE|nr:unnamed protein product [Timema genevievae]
MSLDGTPLEILYEIWPDNCQDGLSPSSLQVRSPALPTNAYSAGLGQNRYNADNSGYLAFNHLATSEEIQVGRKQQLAPFTIPAPLDNSSARKQSTTEHNQAVQKTDLPHHKFELRPLEVAASLRKPMNVDPWDGYEAPQTDG